MTWTKTKTTLFVGASLLFAVIIVITIYHYERYYPWQVRYANGDILDQVPPQVKIVPSKFSSEGGIAGHNGKILGIGQQLDTLMQIIYGIDKSRIVFSGEQPNGRYDFIASLPDDNVKALRQEIENTFRLTVKTEKQEKDVLLLTLKNKRASGLRPNTSSRTPASAEWWGDQYHCINVPLSTLTAFLEQRFEMPVVDQTGLTGNFDIDISWRHSYPETLKQAVLKDLGLVLVPGRKPIEILVVDKAN